MGFLRTLRKFGSAAFRAVAVLYVAFLLCGTVEICLCDPDPDNCGEHCHDCEDHSGHECSHLTVDVDDILAPQTGVSIPAVVLAFFSAPSLSVEELSLHLRPRPSSTAPPDSGGRYISFSSRLHPLS
jgi:hypothetical protein